MYDTTIPSTYLKIIENNYKDINKSGITNTSLSRYFNDCFSNILRTSNFFSMWVCPACFALGKPMYGWGNKPKNCPTCHMHVYQVATFQGRASYTGDMFMYASLYLLNESFKFKIKSTSQTTRLYDLEVSHDIVIEAKGSALSVLNPDGSSSKLGRAGMSRSDTKKKAFANAVEWRKRVPNGQFYIITNSLPNNLIAYHDNAVTGIYDITKKNQLDAFVSELRRVSNGS